MLHRLTLATSAPILPVYTDIRGAAASLVHKSAGYLINCRDISRLQRLFYNIITMQWNNSFYNWATDTNVSLQCNNWTFMLDFPLCVLTTLPYALIMLYPECLTHLFWDIYDDDRLWVTKLNQIRRISSESFLSSFVHSLSAWQPLTAPAHCHLR